MASNKTTRITLSPLDYVPPRNYVRLIFPIPLKEGSDDRVVFDELHRALHQTFVQEPWVSGKVFRRAPHEPGWKPGQLEIRHEPFTADSPLPRQLKYRRLDTEWSFAALKSCGFPSEIFGEDILLEAPRVGEVDVAGADIFIAQANFVEGGLLLGMTTSHASMDAAAMLNITRSWAQNFRELPDSGGRIAPTRFTPEDKDRTLPEKIWLKETEGRGIRGDPNDPWLRGLGGLDSDYPGEDTTGATQRAAIAAAATKSNTNGHLTNGQLTNGHAINGFHDKPARQMINRVMFLSSVGLAALHKRCVAETASSGGESNANSQLSVSDVINALFWRGILRARVAAAQARSTTLDEISVFESPVDARSAFKLPQDYLGNCILFNTARMPVAEIIDPATPIGRIAQRLRQGAAGIDTSTVCDVYSLLRDTPDLSRVQGRFVERPDSADILLSNIIGMPLTLIDFGPRHFGNDGVPYTLRVLHGPYADAVRLGHVLPRNAKHGGVELSVNLFDYEWPYLEADEEFGRYLVRIEP